MPKNIKSGAKPQKKVEITKNPTQEQLGKLLEQLQDRFEKNKHRHKGIDWKDVLARLEADKAGLISVHAMEETGGEPDVIAINNESGAVTFCDCSEQSPSGRRSLCYDADALASRKANKPRGSATEVAEQIGAKLLTEESYARLQELGEFDTTTSSWLDTPAEVRELGGAIFGDRRYDRVFFYHNGAESYYAARGFRVSIEI